MRGKGGCLTDGFWMAKLCTDFGFILGWAFRVDDTVSPG
jgi:hypothetical protein